MRRYLVSMSIRLACFIGVIFTTGALRWVLLAGMVLLPYIAVVNANTGRANSADLGNPMEYLALEAQHDHLSFEAQAEPSSEINDETPAFQRESPSADPPEHTSPSSPPEPEDHEEK